MARKRTKKWIQRAIKKKGALKRMAKRAGMSIVSFCNKVLAQGRKKAPKAWYRCHLYMNVLRKLPKRGRKRRK